MLVVRTDCVYAIKANTKQRRKSQTTLPGWSSASFPQSVDMWKGTESVIGSGHRDWLLPLGWGAIAVIIGIIALIVISSAIAIIIVLK